MTEPPVLHQPEGTVVTVKDEADAFEAHVPDIRMTSLAELEKDYVIFTPALLFSHAGLDKDPIQEFVNRHQTDVRIGVLDMGMTPFIYGLPPEYAEWACKLLVCEKTLFPDLARDLAMLCVMDRKRKMLSKVIPQVIGVTDPFPPSGKPALQFRLAVFSITSNEFRAFLTVRADGHPHAVMLPPDPIMVKMAEQAFNNESFVPSEVNPILASDVPPLPKMKPLEPLDSDVARKLREQYMLEFPDYGKGIQTKPDSSNESVLNRFLKSDKQ